MTPHPNAAAIEQHTRHWLERAVIGLNLCPFAKAVHVKGQIHYTVSSAPRAGEVIQDLIDELEALASISAATRNTTLLIVPDCFPDFLDFNDFLDVADEVLCELELDGILQVASFHPQYQFADTAPDDVTNFTNRAPYPTLHLLREDSVAEAVAAFPEASQIFEQNMETLEKLGADGWAALGIHCAADTQSRKAKT